MSLDVRSVYYYLWHACNLYGIRGLFPPQPRPVFTARRAMLVKGGGDGGVQVGPIQVPED